MNQLKLHEAQFQKTVRSAVFFSRRQPPNCENMTLVARRRKHFRGFWANFWVKHCESCFLHCVDDEDYVTTYLTQDQIEGHIQKDKSSCLNEERWLEFITLLTDTTTIARIN